MALSLHTSRAALAALLLAAGTSPGASAEMVDNFYEGFETLNANGVPEGWTTSYRYGGTGTFTQAEGYEGQGLQCVQSNQGQWPRTGNKYYNYGHWIITPQVEGTVTFWVKKVGDDPTLNLKFVDQQKEGEDADDTSKIYVLEYNCELVGDAVAGGWNKVTATVPADKKHIAIRFHNLIIDDFEAERGDGQSRPGGAGGGLVENIFEGFETPAAGSVVPEGWAHAWRDTGTRANFSQQPGHDGQGLQCVQTYQSLYPRTGRQYYYGGDWIITPQVEGTVTFWVKKVGDSPTLNLKFLDAQVHGADAEDTSKIYALDYDCDLAGEAVPGGWNKITATVPADKKHIAIRFHNLIIDDFEAERGVGQQRPEEHPSLQLGAVTVTGHSGAVVNLWADATGNATLPLAVTLVNDGDVDLSAPFTVSLTAAGMAAPVTADITENVAKGASLTANVNVTGAFPLWSADDEWQKDYTVTVAHAKVETLTHNATLKVHVYPYAPVPSLMYSAAHSALNTHSPSGMQAADAVDDIHVSTDGRTMHLYNFGAAPLTVTALTATEGFAVAADLPFTLARGATKALTVTLADDVQGLVAGTLTIAAEGMDNLVYPLRGSRPAADKLHHTFENGLPAGWQAGAWTTAQTPADLASATDKRWLEAPDADANERLVTERMWFDGNTPLTFHASKASAFSAALALYISADGEQWTKLAEYSGPASLAEITDKSSMFSIAKVDGNNVFGWRAFSVDVPKGWHYLAFEGRAVRLDNISGGEVADEDVTLAVNAPFGEWVEDALVTLSTPDQTFTGTTDAEGSVTLTVLDAAEAYTLTISADQYQTLTLDNVTLLPAGNLFTLEYADLTATLSGLVMLKTADSLIPAAGAAVTATAEGVESATATVDAEGAFVLTLPDYRAPWSVVATLAGALDAEPQQVAFVGTKVGEMHFVLTAEASAIGSLDAATEGTRWYTLQGVPVAAPSRGIYLRRGADGNATVILIR